jgi:hypothetical protein
MGLRPLAAAAFALFLGVGCGSDRVVESTSASGATTSTSTTGSAGTQVASASSSSGEGGGSGTGGSSGEGGVGGAIAGTGGSGQGGGSGGAGGGGDPPFGEVVPELVLDDVNPSSPTFGDPVSPRDYLERVSGWYFGYAT